MMIAASEEMEIRGRVRRTTRTLLQLYCLQCEILHLT